MTFFLEDVEGVCEEIVVSEELIDSSIDIVSKMMLANDPATFNAFRLGSFQLFPLPISELLSGLNPAPSLIPSVISRDVVGGVWQMCPCDLLP